MTLAVSTDGGRSWTKRNVETGDGYCMTNNSRDQTNRELSYPSIKQTADGALHMAFTFHRRAIKHVCVTEPWVMRAARD
jgi:predicted neuraminidase